MTRAAHPTTAPIPAGSKETTPDRSHPRPGVSAAARRMTAAVNRVTDATRHWFIRQDDGTDPVTDRPARPALVGAVAVAVATVVHQLLTRPATFIGGQMWAEMGTNYFPTAGSGSLLTQLLATDSGYIPLPQRLIASFGAGLGLAPSVIPYFYSGIALVLTALLVSSICLPPFRAVIHSDLLRVGMALALAILPDFESRTFINFTYFGLVPLAFVTALAVVERRRAVPVWAWSFPVLMISKPAVLAVLPAVVIAAAFGSRRFRRIAVACTLAAIGQIVQLTISTLSGSGLLQSNDTGPFVKLVAAVKYTLGMLGRLSTGSLIDAGPRLYLILGALVLLVLVGLSWWLRGRATVIVVIGLSMVALTMLINCFTFSDVFTRDIALVTTPGLDRRFFGAVVGGVLIVGGTIAQFVEWLAARPVWVRQPRSQGWASAAGPLALGLFVLWFGVAGWANYSRLINSPLQFPLVGSSQWEAQAAAINSADPTVCVPLDPFGWFYGRGCSLLVGQPGLPPDFTYDAVGTRSDSVRFSQPVPDAVRDDQVASIAFMVQPLTNDTQVTATAVLGTSDGSEVQLIGSRDLSAGAGLVQLEPVPGIAVADAVTLQVTFDVPVAVGTGSTPSGTQAVILWMGQPAP